MKLSGILCLLLVAMAPFFFFGGPSYYDSRSLKAGWDLGHVLFFFVATSFMHHLLLRFFPRRRFRFLCGTIFLSVLILGVAIEYLQQHTIKASLRTPDIFDILRNMLGCLLALAFFVRWPSVSPNPVRKLLQGAVICGLFVALGPFGKSLIDEQIARYQFPLLAGFETPFELSRWRGANQMAIEDTQLTHGSKSAKIQLTTAQYSGVSLFYFPVDWTGYSTMHVSVLNPGKETLALHCRIHDDNHRLSGMAFADRYHQKFILRNGWNDLVVPLAEVRLAPKNREMDMSHIQQVSFFVISRPQPGFIYIDNLYLSR